MRSIDISRHQSQAYAVLYSMNSALLIPHTANTAYQMWLLLV